METKIGELEIEQLKSEGLGLGFNYEFTQGNYINYLTLCIEKEGFDMAIKLISGVVGCLDASQQTYNLE